MKRLLFIWLGWGTSKPVRDYIKGHAEGWTQRRQQRAIIYQNLEKLARGVVVTWTSKVRLYNFKLEKDAKEAARGYLTELTSDLALIYKADVTSGVQLASEPGDNPMVYQVLFKIKREHLN